MWANCLQKKQICGEIITFQPANRPDQQTRPGPINPMTRPAQSTGGQPGANQINRGQPPPNRPAPIFAPIFETTRPHICGAKQPTRGQPLTDQTTRPDQITGPTTGAKRPAPIKPTGPTNDPQTGQTIKSNPTPAKCKQPRKRGTF